jgi:hypothetical protein
MGELELSFAAKLGPFLTATLKYKPGASEKSQMNDLAYLLNEHTALYQIYDLEMASAVANSIKSLRSRLGQFGSGKTDHVRETAAMFASACAEFQAQIEALSATYSGNSEAIYTQNFNIMNLTPLMYQLGFAKAFGELRATIRVLLLSVIEQYGLKLPPKLVDLVNG